MMMMFLQKSLFIKCCFIINTKPLELLLMIADTIYNIPLFPWCKQTYTINVQYLGKEQVGFLIIRLNLVLGRNFVNCSYYNSISNSNSCQLHHHSLMKRYYRCKLKFGMVGRFRFCFYIQSSLVLTKYDLGCSKTLRIFHLLLQQLSFRSVIFSFS